MKYTTNHISKQGETFLSDPAAKFKQVPTTDLRKIDSNKAKVKAKVASLTLNLPKVDSSSEGDTKVDRLYQELLKLRIDFAEKENVAPYMILSEETLKQLAVRFDL